MKWNTWMTLILICKNYKCFITLRMNLLVFQTIHYLATTWLSYHLLYIVKLLTLYRKVIKGSTAQKPSFNQKYGFHDPRINEKVETAVKCCLACQLSSYDNNSSKEPLQNVWNASWSVGELERTLLWTAPNRRIPIRYHRWALTISNLWDRQIISSKQHHTSVP